MKITDLEIEEYKHEYNNGISSGFKYKYAEKRQYPLNESKSEISSDGAYVTDEDIDDFDFYDDLSDLESLFIDPPIEEISVKGIEDKYKHKLEPEYNIKLIEDKYVPSYVFTLITTTIIGFPVLPTFLAVTILFVVVYGIQFYKVSTEYSKNTIEPKDETTLPVNKELVNKFKKVYLMPNKTLKFGYELVRLEDSTSDKLVINYGKGEDEWRIFNYESKSMQNAVRMYKKNEVLPDETIMRLLYTYLILIEDRENTETYKHYQDLLDNRDKLENKSYFKSLGKKEQELKEELSMIGQMQDRHIEENKLIINRVKKEYNII